MKPQLKVWHLFALAIIFALASRFQPLPVAHAQGRSVVDAVINVARPSLAYTQAMDYDASGNCTYIGTANSANSGGPCSRSQLPDPADTRNFCYSLLQLQ